MARTRFRSTATGAVVVALLVGSLGAVAPSAVAGADHGGSNRGRVPNPTVTVPTAVGNGIFNLQADLTDFPKYGYEEQEFFLEGSARSYAPTRDLSADGRWKVRESSTAPHKSRLIVRRPTDPRKFNGTVIVEWLNVTAGFDTGPDWQFERTELMRRGFAWVGVSAQYVGIEGTTGLFPGLKASDPERYGSLSHPGDIYSYDIYSQAGQALRYPRGVNPLTGLDVDHLIADGESQSASRMTTYVNAISPLTRLYEAFLIHSRSSGASGLTLADPGLTMPNPTLIRTDIPTPVLVVESENDVLRHLSARQADSSRYRLWEIAGTAHLDRYALGELAIAFLQCDQPVNAGQHHYVMHTAIRRLWKWMRHPSSRSMPSAPLIQFTPTGEVARDQWGNALGGIRTPAVDAPTSTLSGFGNTPAGFCGLFGTTTPFTGGQLLQAHGSRSNYLVNYVVATAQAFKARFILEDDGPEIINEALANEFPG
ncbi:MAG: hypothetical protein JJE46_05985 [Acidimicrobiia bacterium]|nr:hypothetical protein [Acidimicrobiia bacterium]